MSFDTVKTKDAGNTAKSYDEGLRRHMNGIYNNVGIGLIITGVVAYLVSSVSPETAMLLASGPGGLVMFIGLLAFMFIGFNPAKVEQKSLASLQMTFYAFSAFLGAFYSVYMIVYTGESLIRVFAVTSCMFLTSSLYGYITKKDLTGMRGFLMMGLWGIFIASIVNIFMRSTMTDFVISAVGVIVFTGLTAFDVQNIKRTYRLYGNTEMSRKLGIIGAMNLYYNFVILFQFLLRLMNPR